MDYVEDVRTTSDSDCRGSVGNPEPDGPEANEIRAGDWEKAGGRSATELSATSHRYSGLNSDIMTGLSIEKTGISNRQSHPVNPDF